HPLLRRFGGTRADRADRARLGGPASLARVDRRPRSRLDDRAWINAGDALHERRRLISSARGVALAAAAPGDGASGRLVARSRKGEAHRPDLQRAALRRKPAPDLARDLEPR